VKRHGLEQSKTWRKIKTRRKERNKERKTKIRQKVMQVFVYERIKEATNQIKQVAKRV
jgi:hypothetical protein